MDIQYSKSVTFTPTFNDNEKQPTEKQVRITLRPLDFNQFTILSAAQVEAGISIEGLPKDGKLQQTRISLKGLQSLGEIYREYGVGNVEAIENLTINGEPVTPAQLGTLFPLAGLMAEVVMKLVEITTLTEADVGN